MPKLTFGTACYRDFDGVYFTLNALRMYHPGALQDLEIIVVDNDPESPDGAAVRNYLQWIKDVPTHYIPFPTPVGTSAPRDEIFRRATSPYVVCVDSHVLLDTGSVRKLIDFFDAGLDGGNLLQGPMVYDDLKNMSTHFDDVWRAEMWGVWGYDPRGDTSRTECDGTSFEIPAMGLGLFACRKDSWLGFNSAFRGFGGEEFYIHHKYRQKGKRTLCLPWLRWVHRFGRPKGVPYPLTRWNKVRNYVLGHRELGLDLKPVYDHFVVAGLLSQQHWDLILAGHESPPAESGPGSGGCNCGVRPETAVPKTGEPLTLVSWLTISEASGGEMASHARRLHDLAAESETIADFGRVPNVTTLALTAGTKGKVISHARGQGTDALRLLSNGKYEEREGDALSTEPYNTDLLFLGTASGADRLYSELLRWKDWAYRRIAVANTTVFGEKDSSGGPGLLPAIRRFVNEYPEWTAIEHHTSRNGLTVLSKDPRDKKPLPSKLTMAVNFARALKDHVASGMGKVSLPILEDRLAHCSMCEHRNDDRCSLCGCVIGVKAGWETSECPIGRWGAVT